MPAAIPLISAAGTAAAGVAASGIAGGIIGGVMIAGAAMTAVGAITGNKTLSKWGGIASLAGGVAGLATGAWSTAADSIAQQAAKEGAVAFEHGAGAAAGEAGAAAAAGSASTMDGVIQAGAGLGGTTTMPAAQTGGALQSVGQNLAPQVAQVAQVNPTAAAAQGISNAVANTPNIVNGASSIGSGIRDSMKSGMAWAKKNPLLAHAGGGVLQAGLGAIGQQEAIKTEIKLREEAQGRARQRLNDSVKGLTVPVYVPKG